MISIHLIQTAADGRATTHALPAKTGESLMQAAVAAGVDGIAADCGGLLTCATCHVMVREPWRAQLSPVSDDERAMLEFTAAARTAGSRLGCQIVMNPALDGLTADLPASQY
jgi:2Fe-2S ferredoxin